MNIKVNVLSTLCFFEDIEEIEKRKATRTDHILEQHTVRRGDIKDEEKQKDIAKELKEENQRLKQKEEDRLIRNWKKVSVVILLVSLILTAVLILCYVNEYTFLMAKEQWKLLKNSPWFTLGSVILPMLFSVFIAKLYYDRCWDSSKEKAHREFLRNMK